MILGDINNKHGDATLNKNLLDWITQLRLECRRYGLLLEIYYRIREREMAEKTMHTEEFKKAFNDITEQFNLLYPSFRFLVDHSEIGNPLELQKDLYRELFKIGRIKQDKDGKFTILS